MSGLTHAHLDADGYWRVRWLGALATDSPHLRTDHIHVLLTKIPGRRSDGSWDFTPLGQKSTADPLPIPQTPHLHVNAVLKNGHVQSSFNELMPGESKATYSLDFSNGQIIHRFEHDDSGVPFLPYENSPMVDRLDLLKNHEKKGGGDVVQPGILPNMYGFLCRVTCSKTGEVVLIPCYEIFRFFYAASSRMASSVIRGDFLDFNHMLWSEDKSVIENRKAFIYVRSKVIDPDIPHLARFAFDPYAIEQACRVKKEMSRWYMQGAGRLLRAAPPIRGSHDFNVICVKVNSSVSVVTRILSCNWVPLFDELSHYRENDHRKVDGQDATELQEYNRPRKITAVGDEKDNVVLEKEPISGWFQHKIIKNDEVGERFPNFAYVKISQAEKLEQKYKSGTPSIEIASADGKLSTVNGVSSAKLLQEAILAGDICEIEPSGDVSDNEIDPNIVDGDGVESKYVIPTIIRMIRMFKAYDAKDVHVDFLNAMRQWVDLEGVPVGVYFPYLGGKERYWCWIDRRGKKRRLVTVVKLMKDGRVRYVLDPQQRKVGESSALIFWASDEGEIEGFKIREALNHCAVIGKLNLSAFCGEHGFSWKRRPHLGVEGNAEAAKRFITGVFQQSKYENAPGHD